MRRKRPTIDITFGYQSKRLTVLLAASVLMTACSIGGGGYSTPANAPNGSPSFQDSGSARAKRSPAKGDHPSKSEPEQSDWTPIDSPAIPNPEEGDAPPLEPNPDDSDWAPADAPNIPNPEEGEAPPLEANPDDSDWEPVDAPNIPNPEESEAPPLEVDPDDSDWEPVDAPNIPNPEEGEAPPLEANPDDSGWAPADAPNIPNPEDPERPPAESAKPPENLPCPTEDACSDKGLGMSTGTGFFVNDTGYLLTNQHVVADHQQLFVMVDGEALEAELIDESVENDIALLRVDASVEPLPISLSLPRQGDSITVLGFPNIQLMGNELKATFGYVNALTGAGDDDQYLQFDASIQPGSSGSPVLDQYGQVVGVATSTLDQSVAIEISGTIAQNVNYAVKTEYTVEFLSMISGVQVNRPQRSTLSNPDLVEQAASSVVLIVNYFEGHSPIQEKRTKAGGRSPGASGGKPRGGAGEIGPIAIPQPGSGQAPEMGPFQMPDVGGFSPGSGSVQPGMTPDGSAESDHMRRSRSGGDSMGAQGDDCLSGSCGGSGGSGDSVKSGVAENSAEAMTESSSANSQSTSSTHRIKRGNQIQHLYKERRPSGR